jgi:hypothetical protein
MTQDERARIDRALHRARLSAHPPGEFVGQEGFMPHMRERFSDTALADPALLP